MIESEILEETLASGEGTPSTIFKTFGKLAFLMSAVPLQWSFPQTRRAVTRARHLTPPTHLAVTGVPRS